MSSLLAERRTRARVPEEISPELALVCPDTRRRARERLPDRDPYAFLVGVPRERDAADAGPEAERPPSPLPAPPLRLVPPAQVGPRVVVERPELGLAASAAQAALVLSARAVAPAVALPAPTPRPQPPQIETVRPAPSPRAVPAAPRPQVAAAVPGSKRSAFLAYAARELAMLGIAAVATVAGLTGTLTIIDLFFVR